MSAAHAALAWLSVVPLVAVGVAAAATAAGILRSYLALDRLLLVQLALAVLVSATGLVSLVATGGPADALHLLYGAVVAAVPGVARAVAHGRRRRSVGRWVAVAAVVALGATVRSFMTGS